MAATSLHEAIAEYLEWLRHSGTPDGTVKAYRSVLYRLYRFLGKRQCRSLKTTDLYRFLYGPQGIGTGKAVGTRNVQRSALKSFIRHGKANGWCPRNLEVPEPVIRQRSSRQETRPTRLAPGALGHLLDACPETSGGYILRGMLAVGINTAWRTSDIVKIRMPDISLPAGELYLLSKKTQKMDAFPITMDLDEELRRYLSWYTGTQGVVLGDDVFLFPGWRPVSGGWVPQPSRQASPEWARSHLKTLLVTCGVHVEKGEAWHVIRRSVARIYFDSLRSEISRDHALRQTAALLHHDSTVTTERYLGLSTEIAARDESLRGKRFIGVQRSDNVIALPR